MTKKKIILKNYNIFLFIFIFLFSISFTYAPLTPLTFNDPVDENFISPTPFYTFNFSYTGTQDASIFLDFDNTVLTYLNFENVSGTTVFDSSTYGRNATLIGGASIDSTNSIRGNNVNINGNHRVDLAPISTPLTDFTVSFWFRSNTAIPSSNNPNFVLYETDSIDIYFIQTNNGRILFQQGASNFLTNRNSWSAGTWYHIVYTYNTTDNNLSVYVNGDLDNSVIRAGVNIDASSTHNFGRQLFGTQYRGRLDEFLLMNRTINPSEVLGLYDANSGDVNAYVGNLDDRVYEYRACVIEDNGDFSCTQDRTFEVFDGPIPVEVFFENSFTNQQTADISVVSMLAQNVQFSCDNSSWSDIYVFEDFRVNSTTAVIPLEITNSSIGCDINEGVRTIFVNATGFFDPGFNSTTITYDITPPSIFDVTPLNGSVISTSITNFQFQVNDTLSPINNCILFIDGFQDGDIEFSIPQDTPFTFSRNSTDIGLGDREFAISCQDEAGNSQVIQPREFLMAVEAPDIQNLTFSTQRAGFGEEVVIELIVPEPFGGYDTVFFEITPQSGSAFNITPTLVSSDTFRYIYTQTWEEGVVNVYAFVNTTGGLFDEIESNFTINSSLQASIFTSRDSYLQGEIIDLTSSFSWFDTSWNYRFLNILEPQQIFRNSVIFNERINFSQKLEQRNEFGNININSIRIIEYDSSGSPIMFDSTRIGDERFFIDYEVSGDESSQYDGVTNAVLDIAFALEDEIEINQERYFMIYFDVEENGPKPTSSSQIDNIVFPISCNNPFVKTTDDTGAHYFIPINDDGTFGNEEFLFSNGDRIRGEAIADFSGDGNCDFLYFSNTQNRFFGVRQTDEYVFSQPFDLNITSPSPSMSGWQMDMAVGDFTNNYFQDVITSGNNGRLYILENSGNFDFSARLITTSTPGGAGRCKDSGDLNNNGILDFIYGSTSDNGNIYAYFGNGDGTFQAPVLIASALTGNNQMYGCALGYFNEDNYLDLAVIGGNSGDTYLFTSNDGSGTSFTNQGIVFSFGRDGALASYDVNKNGFDDLLVATNNLQSIRFYENNQDETFTLNSEIGNSFALGIGAPESRSQGDMFTINSVQLVPDNLDFSTIFNELTNEENFYSRLEVEFFSSGSWSFYDVIYDDFSSSLTTLFRNSTFSIRDKYINEGGFDSSGAPLGNYRFRLLLKDDSNDVLVSDSSELEFFSNVFNISVDSNPPTFNVISYTPEITGYGDSISFNTFVTDFTGVDVVYVNITLPDSSVETLVLNPSSVNNYVNTFSNTWQRGVYNLVFFANDTLSNTRVVSGESFEITSNLALNMATTKDEYFVGEIVDITSAFSWVDNNWNFRIPVTLDSTQKRRFNALLENEYNFTQILSDLGISGTFSQNSLRVVEFDSLGDPIVYNSSNSGIDRYSIPLNIELSNEFEPTDNALVKVSFFAQGQTLGNEQRNFQIFFDIEENGIKSSAINLNTLPLPNFDLDGSGTQKLIFGHEAQRLLIYNPVTDNVEFQSAPHRRYAQLGYGDLRNTGALEILYGGQDSNIWSYQYNEITNIFEQTGSFGFVRYGLSVGDVTGDGVQNLVTGLNQNNILNVYEFDGSSYQLIEDIPLAVFGGTNPRNLAVGDFNQNGRDEIAVLGYTNGNWFGILEYDEATDDYDMVYFLDLPGTAVGLGFYDTSGNGMPNIWFGGSSGQVYNVEYNDITEEYELVWQTNIGGAWVGSFDFADFNNNGRTNIVTSRNTGRQVVVFEYDNQGGYDEIYTSNVLPNAQRDGLVPMFIDFNGDGELGVAIGGRNGYIEFFDIGNPDPVFSRQFNPPGTNRVAAHFGSSMLVMGRGDPRGIQYPYISDITIGFAEERSQSPEKSFVRNIGSTLTFSYTNFEIEFYNETTSSWESVVIIFDGASSSEINSGLGVGGLFSLRDEFINRGSFNSTGFEPGLYRINFAFTDPFGNVLENSDLSLVQTSYEFNLTLDESGPDILGSIVSPNITGVGDFVTIQVDAQDFSGIDRVWANITYPDSSTMMLDLNQITTLRYQLQFNNTWQRGEYEVEIYLNDTNGFLSSVNYTFEIVGDVDISIATLENLYFPDSLVDLTSPFSWWVTDWNYRIPLILEASNAPRPYVLLREKVDFTQSLAEISQLGIFDINSIRVVEYDVFGNPVVYNSSRSGDDRFIIPTRFTPASDFSATTNAAGILEFKVEGPIPANTQRNYLIYFDIEENGIKSPPYRSFTPPKEFLAYVRETGIGAVIEYTGTGSTGFASQSIFGSFSSSNDRSRGIVIADFTNNGMFDIVFGGSGGSLFADLKFFEQTAPMNFVDRGITSQNSIFANRYTMDLVAGDFNNNGNMDLIFSGNTNEVYFIPGNGDGTFGQEQLVYSDLGNIRGKAVGDFTGNGNLDVIFTMSGSSGRFILLRGLGDGTFVEVSLFNPPSNDGYCLTGGDFNNNGFLDLFYDPRSSSTSQFFAGDGTGGFSSPQSLFSVPDFSGCDAYDFNRDGNLDVYMVIRDGDVLEHRGFGDGTFQTPAQATVLGTPDSRTFAISAPNTFEFETSTFNIQTRADSSIPSRILNNINAVTRPYINLSVEFYNETTTSWEFYDVLVDTLQQAIFENSLLDLRTYYETFGRWNTTNSQSGLYSVVLRLEDNVGNILTNISGQDYMKRFNFTITTDVEGPTYNNFVITPENVGYNQSVSFRVDVLDESGVDSVWANITTPSGQSTRVELEQFFGARYVFDNYSPTWEFGDYNITIFANDTLSQLSNISQIFRVSAISDISMNVGRFSYFSNSTVDITNSFILNSDFTNYSFYLEMGVERLNASSQWELYEVVIDNLALLNKTNISTNQNINLVSIWDSVGRWNTTDSLGGFYRIYTRLVDNESNTLLQNDSTPLFQTTPAFNVLNISGATIINNYQIEPQTLGLGRTSTIQINVSSTAGIDTVWANITNPNAVEERFEFTNIIDDLYELNFSNTWINGEYNITIFANNTNSDLVSVDDILTVFTQADVNVKTIEDIYFDDNIVLLDSSSSWWDIDWKYRLPVTLNEESGRDLENYFTYIELDTQTLISQGRVNENGSDIRIIDENNNELISQIDLKTLNTPSTRVWFETNLSNSGSRTVFVYYGNPLAQFPEYPSRVSSIVTDSATRNTIIFDDGWEYRTSTSYGRIDRITLNSQWTCTEGHLRNTNSYPSSTWTDRAFDREFIAEGPLFVEMRFNDSNYGSYNSYGSYIQMFPGGVHREVVFMNFSTETTERLSYERRFSSVNKVAAWIDSTGNVQTQTSTTDFLFEFNLGQNWLGKYWEEDVGACSDFYGGTVITPGDSYFRGRMEPTTVRIRLESEEETFQANDLREITFTSFTGTGGFDGLLEVGAVLSQPPSRVVGTEQNIIDIVVDSNYSGIRNEQTLDFDSYIFAVVQRDIAGTWTNVETIINNEFTTIDSSAFKDISKIWIENGNFSTLSRPLGEYRVLVELRDNVSNLLLRIKKTPLIGVRKMMSI